jgi:3-deoxy-D-manno-octulosonic-acid transferase
MTLALYSMLVWLLQPLLRWKLRRRARREPGYLVAVEERFGFYATAPGALPRSAPDAAQALPGAGPLVWMHAVSLGETRACAVLLEALRRQWPGMRLLLTHSTATGRTEGARLLRAGDRQVWLPWDTNGAVLRFLQQFKPALGVLVETEVWPNLLLACRREGVPVALVNARMSQRSTRRAQRVAALSRQAFGALSMVLAQSQGDAQRLASLGARVDAVLGNLKFDATPDEAQLAQGRAWRARSRRPLLMFASSREGEEAMWLAALPRQASQARWLLVPRHPQRFDEVAQLLRARGLSLARASQWNDGPDEAALNCDVWLGDSLGDMARYYGMSDCALLGGSFAPLGGHNLIEAAACACPVVMGPHSYNFAEAAAQAQASGAAFAVASMEQGVARMQELIDDPEALRAAAAACASFSAAHRGCARKTALALDSLLGAGTS